MNRNLRNLAGASLLALALPLFAQPPVANNAYVSTATDLKREPSRESETLQALPANTALQSLKRQGSWVQVQHGEQVGWVRMLVVRSGTPGAAKKGESGLARLFNLARSGSSGAVTTTGVRGLDKEQIQNATPHPAELAKLDGYAADEAQARKLASSKPALSTTAVTYVKADGSAEEAK